MSFIFEVLLYSLLAGVVAVVVVVGASAGVILAIHLLRWFILMLFPDIESW